MKMIVVGAGIMGLCAAWALRRLGHLPVVYEQGPVPNPLGSSVDQHRLIRFTYGAMSGYARMVHGAYAAWDRLWADLGARHYAESGTLVVARGESDGWVRTSFDDLEDMGLPVERWGNAEIATRLPFLDLEGARWALYTPTGGVLFAKRIVAGLAGHLRAHGMAVHEGRKVADLDPARAGVRLQDGRSDQADALIVAAGPWAPRLLSGLVGRVTPSRQIAVYLEPPPDHQRAWGAAPMLLDQIEAAKGGFYAVPPVGGAALKIGDHGFSMTGDPDREREATAADVDATLAMASTRLAGFERYRVLEARTCFYSVAESERFIVEPVERAWMLAGFSGHGFKFGPALGEAVAETIDGRRAPESLTWWAAGKG